MKKLIVVFMVLTSTFHLLPSPCLSATTVTTRASKGSTLTWTEQDTNITNLRDAIDGNEATNAAAIAALQAGQAGGLFGFETKSAMDADLAHAAGTLARVTNDSTNNGLYIKLGASGSGSWQKSTFQDQPFTMGSMYSDNLNTAVSAIGSTPTVLLFSSDMSVNANITIPATLELMPINGAKINHTTYTISYAGPVERWPDRQIFNGTGAVTGLKEALVEWFGAVGDGTTSDKTAIEATFAAAYKIIFTQGKEYNADGANLTQVGRTLTGGGTIKDSYLLIGPTGTTRLDMDLHIDGLDFVYTSLGDSQPGLRLRNCRQYTISNCYFENTDRSIEYLPIDSIQNDGKGTISDNIFENVNYCVYNDVTALTVAYLVADVHYVNNISTARKTHLYIPLQDGMIISKNTMFFPSYTTSDATKERHIYSSGSNWLIITQNNLFESGLESIYLGEPRTYEISNNLIAWSGQRQRSSVIKIVKASTPTLAQSGTISDNQIIYGSLYGIDLGQYVRQVDVDHNRIFGMGEDPASGVYYGGEAAVPYYHIYVYPTDDNISITNNIGKNDTAGTASYSMPTVSQAYFNVVKNNTQLLSGSRMETISLARTYTATGTDTEYDASGFDTLYISPSSGTTVTAIGGVFNGKIVNIWSSNSNLTLDSDYTGTPSSGYYKFNLKGGSNVTLTAGQMVRLEYHSALSKWLEISRNF